VTLDGAPWSVVSYLMGDVTAVPTAAPTLPPPVTVVGLPEARDEGLVLGRLPLGRGSRSLGMSLTRHHPLRLPCRISTCRW